MDFGDKVVLVAIIGLIAMTTVIVFGVNERCSNPTSPIQVDITAYSPDEEQTDSTPFEMASGRIATIRDLEKLRYIAVSRDLIKKYGIEYGDTVYIAFEVQDTMNQRIKNGVDIFMRNKELARKWGRQVRKIVIVRRK